MTSKLGVSILLIGHSLHQAWVSAHRREVDRSRHHSIHLRGPDVCLVLLRLGGVTMLALQETTGKFRGGYGCKPSCPTLVFALLMMIGFRQLQFAPHLPGHVALPDPERPALGPRPE